MVRGHADDIPQNDPTSRTVIVRERLANDPTRYLIDMGGPVDGPEIGFYPGPLALVPGQRVRAQWNKDMFSWQLTGPGFAGCDFEEVDSIPSRAGGENILLSSDDAHLIFLNGSTIEVYPFDNTDGTIGTLVDSQAHGVGVFGILAISPADDYIAVGGSTSPRIEVYNFDNSTGLIGAKVTDVSPVPTSRVRAIDWNPAGTFLAVALDNSPFFTVWAWSAGFGTKATDPALPSPIGDGTGITWHPDGDAIAGSYNSSVTDGLFAAAWGWTGQFGPLLGQPAVEITGASIATASANFSDTGNHVVFGEDTTALVQPSFHVFPFNKATGFGVEVPHYACGPFGSPLMLQVQWVKNDQFLVYPHDAFSGTRNVKALWGAVSFDGTDFGTCCVGKEDTTGSVNGPTGLVVDSTDSYVITTGGAGINVTSWSITLGVASPGQGLSISDLLNVSIT